MSNCLNISCSNWFNTNKHDKSDIIIDRWMNLYINYVFFIYLTNISFLIFTHVPCQYCATQLPKWVGTTLCRRPKRQYNVMPTYFPVCCHFYIINDIWSIVVKCIFIYLVSFSIVQSQNRSSSLLFKKRCAFIILVVLFLYTLFCIVILHATSESTSVER